MAKAKSYKIQHPKTGKEDSWTDEQIQAYQTVKRVKVKRWRKPRTKK